MQKQTQSVSSRGWSGARLSVKTRYGKDLSLKYSNRVWQCDHSCADVLLVDSQLLGLPEGVRMKHEPIQLCGACYAEVPCRKIQFKKTQRHEKHELTLLPECPKVGQGLRFRDCGLMGSVCDVLWGLEK